MYDAADYIEIANMNLSKGKKIKTYLTVTFSAPSNI
jgi:hypothetical protein